MRPRVLLCAVLFAAALPACGARSELRTPVRPGDPDAGPCAPAEAATLAGRIRDFSSSHPDFEKTIGDDPGIVGPDLGPDGTPVYAKGPSGTTATTTGQANFEQWYHDTPGVNLGEDFSLPLTGDLTAFTFDSDAFFPIDGALLGDEGRPHNYHFTLALHGRFRYQGGEVFSLAGDDDLWLFVAGRLAVDLGGVHSSESGSVSVDTLAEELGLEPNGVYPIDVFFAERHTEGSTLHVRLGGPELCVVDG